MHDKETDRFVDDLLDASLRQYRSQEPRAGLETRILANVRARERAARGGIWVWALGAAAAAALAVVAAVLYVPHRRPAPVAPVPQARAGKPELPLAVAVVPSAPSAARAEIRPVRRVTAERRRPEQFPTPIPLTEQEKLLLLYVKNTPSSELEAQVVQQPRRDLEIPKISIAALEVKPLPGAENGQEN
jgi:hypothetical protein